MTTQEMWELLKKHWRAAGSGVLLGISVLWPVVSSFSPGKREQDAFVAENTDRLSWENFEKLKVGMTLQELDKILGGSRQASSRDLEHIYFWSSRGVESCAIRAWERSTMQGKVRIWRKDVYSDAPVRSDETLILAAFPRDSSADSKVEVLLRTGPSNGVNKPGDKWIVNKDNFEKLRVGMSLKELEDLIGVGGQFPDSYSIRDIGGSWKNAMREGRVYLWSSGWGDDILAAFSQADSLDAKVEALSFRGANGLDADKGVLSSAKVGGVVDREDTIRLLE